MGSDADRGYDADWIRAYGAESGAWANIPPRCNRTSRSASALISIVPATWTNGSSTTSSSVVALRPATTLAANDLAFIQLASIGVWLRVNESAPLVLRDRDQRPRRDREEAVDRFNGSGRGCPRASGDRRVEPARRTLPPGHRPRDAPRGSVLLGTVQQLRIVQAQPPPYPARERGVRSIVGCRIS